MHIVHLFFSYAYSIVFAVLALESSRVTVCYLIDIQQEAQQTLR